LSIKGILFAQLVGVWVALIFVFPNFVKTYRPWRTVRAASGGILKEIIVSYGKWELPRSFSRNLVGKVRPWIIRLFLNTEAVGIFGVANMAISLLKDLMPTRTLSVLIPRKIHEPRKLTFIFFYGTKCFVLLSLGLVALGSALYPLAIYFVFPHLSASIVLFYLLLPTVVLFAFIKLTNIFLVVKRRQKFLFYQSVLEQGLGVVLLFFFLPIFGILGLALAELLAFSFAIAVKYYYLTKTKFIKAIPWRYFSSFNKEERKKFLVMWRQLFRILDFTRLTRFLKRPKKHDQ
jgi:O-antigen/teichoic acid export membrane protein